MLFTLVGATAAASALHYLRTSKPQSDATTAAATAVASPQRPSIVLFGDSITQFSFNPELCGWGAAMTHWYARQADVLNRGFSGYNTRQALPLLRRLLPLPAGMPAPRLLIIKFGANDAALPSNVKQHVPLDEYESNLTAMLRYAREVCPGICVILITPPSVDEDAIRKHNEVKYCAKPGAPLDRLVDTVSTYADAVRRVGLSCDAPVVDLWTDGEAAVGADTADFCDGLHLDSSGNRKVFAKLQRTIRDEFSDGAAASQMLPDDDPDTGSPYMPMQFPYWANANVQNIQTWS